MFHLLHTLSISADHWLFLLINRDMANPVFDSFFGAVTEGRFWVIPGILAIILFVKHDWQSALIAIGLALLTVAITDPLCDKIIKPLFHRLRPCNPDHFIAGGAFLLGMKTSLSFPSAHAMNMFGQAALFSYLYRNRWPWFFGFASMIAFSRVYLGAHYPLDVLGGAICGVLIGFCVATLYDWTRRKIGKKSGGASPAPIPRQGR
jgi:undecaprenyl-diphosphatase